MLFVPILDQGLFYHFPKYVRRSMTQILARKIVSFGLGPNGTTAVTKHWKVTSREDIPFVSMSKQQYPFGPRNCRKIIGKENRDRSHPGCVPPYSDYHHFTSSTKPWERGMPVNLTLPKNRFKSSHHLWWQTLLELQEMDGANLTRM